MWLQNTSKPILPYCSRNKALLLSCDHPFFVLILVFLPLFSLDILRQIKMLIFQTSMNVNVESPYDGVWCERDARRSTLQRLGYHFSFIAAACDRSLEFSGKIKNTKAHIMYFEMSMYLWRNIDDAHSIIVKSMFFSVMIDNKMIQNF